MQNLKTDEIVIFQVFSILSQGHICEKNRIDPVVDRFK